MKKVSKNSLFSELIFFLFYILVSTSGIISIFYLLGALTILIQTIFVGSPLLIEELSFTMFFGLPALGLVLISLLIIRLVKSTQLFFFLTFFIIFISHFLLSRSTSVELGDVRLVLAAVIYVGFLSFTLTIARQRILIRKNYKESFLLLIATIISVIINSRPPEFLDKAYMSFAWNLNSIDYLFSRLNLDFIYFVIIVVNVISCLAVLILIYVSHILGKNKPS